MKIENFGDCQRLMTKRQQIDQEIAALQQTKRLAFSFTGNVGTYSFDLIQDKSGAEFDALKAVLLSIRRQAAEGLDEQLRELGVTVETD